MTQAATRVPFEQAGIRVEKLESFAQLQSALSRIFGDRAVENFLQLLQRKGVPIRDFDRVMNERLLEQSDAQLAGSGKTAKQWYESLTVSDQAQIREFYLTALEAIELPLREKYKKLYRYY